METKPKVDDVVRVRRLATLCPAEFGVVRELPDDNNVRVEFEHDGAKRSHNFLTRDVAVVGPMPVDPTETPAPAAPAGAPSG